MAAYFTDSSAVIKRYLRETGSVWVRELFAVDPSNEFYAVATVGVEVVAAITRRVRGGIVSRAGATRWCGVFLTDLESEFVIVNVTGELLRLAVSLARAHGLRGYDAVQLAAALEANSLRLGTGLSPLIFLSADQELNTAARSEGLLVDDPNAHV